MKSLFSIILVMAVLNPFCCCWAAAVNGDEVQEVTAHCCGGEDDDKPQKEHHDPGDCPHQNWMKNKYVTAELKAQAPVLLDLHFDLPEMSLLFVEDWQSAHWTSMLNVEPQLRGPLAVQQVYCVRLL